MSAIFGLDFGTSNSSLSANVNGNVQLLNIDKDNQVEMSLKSILYFLKEKKKIKAYVGHEAIKEYIETEGEGRYIQSIKTFLPNQTFERTEIFNKNYTLEELIAFILKTIKTRGENIIKEEVTRVVLGRPVLFSEDEMESQIAQDRLLAAAKLAGFKDVIFQLEPVAAALAFENDLGFSEEKLLLVGDFGAGTSDFTVLKANKKNQTKTDRTEDILANEGVYIGGDLFDSDIMWHKICKYYGKGIEVNYPLSNNPLPLPGTITGKLRQWHLIPQLRNMKTLKSIKEYKYLANKDDKRLIKNLENLIEYNYGYMLFRAIEKSKCELSREDFSDISYTHSRIDIDEHITRKEFEAFIADKVTRIDQCVTSLLKKADISPDDINAVFLTGGSSHIPIIKQIFEQRFKSADIKQYNPFTSIAYGLGLYSKIAG